MDDSPWLRLWKRGEKKVSVSRRCVTPRHVVSIGHTAKLQQPKMSWHKEMHWCMGLSMDIWKIGCLESHAIIKNVRYTVGIISLFYFLFTNLANTLIWIKFLLGYLIYHALLAIATYYSDGICHIGELSIHR